MRKNLSYIIIGILAIAVIGLFLTGNTSFERRDVLDERISFRPQDKIPYGFYFVKEQLPVVFPNVQMETNRYGPGYWKSIDADSSNQVLLIFAQKFHADAFEIKKLIQFVEKGNDVFVSASYISAATDKVLKCNSSSVNDNFFSIEELRKHLQLSILDPTEDKKDKYEYPGRGFDSYFTSIDKTTTTVLGYDRANHPQFLHLKAGKGNFFVHLEPFAFSNYFLLHKNNFTYLEKVFSFLQPNPKKIIWDEYYLNKPEDEPKPRDGWMSVFFRYPALKAALLTAIFTLLLYVLLGLRRKQRPIPILKKPKNDSLDFVKTIGRLYYEKGNHLNLATKMSAYFLEHVRAKYKLATGNLGEEFCKNLELKSGIDAMDVKNIVAFILFLETAPVISDKQLATFHAQLNLFYSKT